MISRTFSVARFEGTTLGDCSPSFLREWVPALSLILERYGQAPPQEVLFALPLTRSTRAIVSASENRFYVRVMSRQLYDVIPDPFLIAEKFPANWLHSPLEDLEWPNQPLPPRTIAQLEPILREGNGALLLGATQTLVDGGRLVLQRELPDAKTLRDMWMFLPDGVRREHWLATWVPQANLPFTLAVQPLGSEIPPEARSEEQAMDYPESRFEFELQHAIETNNQEELERLLNRSGLDAVFRRTFLLLLGLMATGVAIALLSK